MEPKVLADALVEAGIGEKDPAYPEYWPYGIANNDGSDHSWLSSYEFITDWRVAGKVLESMGDFVLENSNGGISLAVIYDTTQPRTYWKRGPTVVSESLPRAIIEAWYAAQEGEGE